MTVPFDQIACGDFETYYDDDYSLRKMTTTDYIRDERFEAQTLALRLDAWREPSTAVGAKEIAELLQEVDWTRTAFLAHHTQFDGLILTHHFGVYPRFWLDTMSMARAIFGVHDSVSLNSLAQKLGLAGKVHKQALDNVKGVRVADMSDETIERLAEYNEDDTNDTLAIYRKLAPVLPESEKRVIDITVRMYTEPTLLIDGERVERVHAQERARKQELFDKIGLNVGELRKDKVFAAELRALNVEPPMKLSLKRHDAEGNPLKIYAFAKNDYEFQGLLSHPDDRVRWLVEGRLASKSTLVETRSASILKRVGRPTPIYLNYWGAHTGRWSGGDGVNWQNLPRRGLGGELRKSLVAPEGHKLIVSDAAQIEARLLAWHARQDDIVEVFRQNGDVYALAAGNVYGFVVVKSEHPDERFVGKVLTLGAGYGASGGKINYMLKIGAFGPPVLQTMQETEDLVQSWRASNRYIKQHWYKMRDMARTAFLNYTEIDDGIVCFEGRKSGGYIHMPNGTYIYYPNVYWDGEQNGMMTQGRNGAVCMWHGLIAENVNQALARAILAEQMIEMEDAMPEIRFASSTHDESLIVVPAEAAEHDAQKVQRIMSTPPAWCSSLPLNAETTVSTIYEKS